MCIRRHHMLLAGVFAFGLADVATAQQNPRRIGVGAAIVSVNELFTLNENRVATPVILVPIQLSDGFRLEPELGVIHQRQDEPDDASASAIEAGIGVFPQTLQDNFRLYYGVRLGYVRTKQEEDESVPGVTLTQTQKADGFFVAPAVGGEYMFSNRFSLGAEIQFRYTSVKGDSAITSDSTLPRGIVLPPPTSLETTTSATRVLFITRFYF